MPFPFDIYPWTNYQELNLAYFIARFQEIFSQWANLYDTMTAWQTQTSADLETWKNGVIIDITARESALQQELSVWKTTTEQDISSWETTTLTALNAWQTAAEAAFEAIRTAAATSATAAAGSATDAAAAKTAAETAQAAAEAAAASVTASAEQIATNTAGIAAQKAITDALPNTYASLTESNGNTIIITNDNRESVCSSDLNNLPIGNYRVGSAAIAENIANSPMAGTSNASYRVYCLASNSGGVRYQIALMGIAPTGTYPRIALRTRNSSNVWSGWLYIQDTRHLVTLLAADRTQITSDACDPNINIDNILAAGTYVVPKSTVAAAMSGTVPTTDTGFDLIVMQTVSTSRWIQIAILNRSTSSYTDQIRIRTKTSSGAWNTWKTVALAEAVDEQISTISAAVSAAVSAEELARQGADAAVARMAISSDASHYITASNASTYFPTLSYNDAVSNSIYRITAEGDARLTDGPEGDAWIADEDHTDRGDVAGTLLTFSYDPADTNGIAQVFFGYRARSSGSPTISWRIARYDGNSYTWSSWSKLTQNGVLRSSNTIVYAGYMSYTFDDLDDMPRNTIAQLDLNLNGSDADHTLAHHPFPGVSCVAMNYAFSSESQHGMVQTVYALDGRMAWRYGYLQAGVKTWTAWYTIPKLPALPSSDGTYVLTCTVGSGTKTLSWEAQT